MTEIKSCLDYIEWEGLQKPYEIDSIDITDHIFTGTSLIKIWRDESYNIKAIISGIPNKNDLEKISEGKIAGERIPTFQITGTSHGGTTSFELNGCYLTKITESIIGNEQKFEAPLMVTEVKKKTNNKKDVAWLTDWYLNGSDFNSYFPRCTDRKGIVNFERARSKIDKETKKFSGGCKNSLDSDFAFIDVKDFRFIISRVPTGLGPDWSCNIGIEFRNEFGGIPNSDKRESIGEIASLIIGRQLLPIGHSTFSDDGYPIEHVSFSPWGSNVIDKCERSDESPIEISSGDRKSFESILSDLSRSYLNLRDNLCLRDVLWQYWIAQDNPIGTNLPIFSSALETLKKAWFKSKDSKSKGVYMPKEDFNSLLEEDFKIIEEKLKEIKCHDRILNRMGNAFQMGVNEQFQFFFDEIALSISDIENKVINSRNKMAHGHSTDSEEKQKEMVIMTWAYETLIHRVLLKILGYRGEYVDRSSLGFPKLNINTPMLMNIN